MGASPRLEAEPVQSRDLPEEEVELMDDLKDPLNRFLRLKGVHLGELGCSGELLVDLRAVLHGTGALPDIHVQVRAQVFLRQA
jgi:hypothetical protein